MWQTINTRRGTHEIETLFLITRKTLHGSKFPIARIRNRKTMTFPLSYIRTCCLYGNIKEVCTLFLELKDHKIFEFLFSPLRREGQMVNLIDQNPLRWPETFFRRPLRIYLINSKITSKSLHQLFRIVTGMPMGQEAL